MSNREERMRRTRDLIRDLNVVLAKIDAITDRLRRKRKQRRKRQASRRKP
jgi:hypothetical protein